MDNLQVPLTLTVADINTVLALLAKAPFDVAAPLINKIQGQANPVVLKAQQEQREAEAKANAAAVGDKAAEAIAAAANAPVGAPAAKRPNRKARRAQGVLNGAGHEQPAQ